MKVFCIGYQKTGTSSLRDALELLGFDVAGVFAEERPLEELRASFVEEGLRIAHEHDAVEDMPWPLMFRELDHAFPEAKFILTVRDLDRWYASILRHFGSRPRTLQELAYGKGAAAPEGNEERYKSVYSAHIEAVRDYFTGRDCLLEMDLEKGDGWPELGAFLRRTDVPDGPFVHTNSAKQRAGLSNRIRIKLHKMGLPVRRIDR